MKQAPTFRTLKKKVGQILMLDSRNDAMERFKKLPEDSLAGPLFSHFYSLEDVIRFRSTFMMGEYAAGLEKNNIERVRILLRRLMWNLNDESGGIGWGSCEAMGEILKRSGKLAAEFGSILFSYLDPDGNYLEHDMLQRGLLWGVGTFLETAEKTDQSTWGLLSDFLHSSDLIKRGYAARALAFSLEGREYIPEDVLQDPRAVPVFDGWYMKQVPIAGLAQRQHADLINNNDAEKRTGSWKCP